MKSLPLPVAYTNIALAGISGCKASRENRLSHIFPYGYSFTSARINWAGPSNCAPVLTHFKP